MKRSSVQAALNESGNETEIKLTGAIDENARFDGIAVAAGRPIVLDLQGVGLINSLGIRAWLLWMKDFSKGRLLRFKNCPRVFIDQLNVIAGFLPAHSTIESFFVPYYCPQCDINKDVLFRLHVDFEARTADAPENVIFPEVRCDKCGQPMEIEVTESRYFGFLGNTR